MATKSQDQWEAENDAQTLVSAEAIKADEPRYKKAQVAAKKLLKEQEDKAAAMKKIAGAKLEYKNTPKEENGNK